MYLHISYFSLGRYNQYTRDVCYVTRSRGHKLPSNFLEGRVTSGVPKNSLLPPPEHLSKVEEKNIRRVDVCWTGIPSLINSTKEIGILATDT